MYAVCEDKEHKEHNLESGEGAIGCNYDGRGCARCEDGGDKIGEEGCHGGCGKTHSGLESRALGYSGTTSRKTCTPIRKIVKFSERSFAVYFGR